MTSTEIAKPTNAPTVFTDSILAKITSFDDAKGMLDSTGIVLESMSDYGTGFSIMEKSKLVGVPFLILEWRFNNSDLNEGGFVSVAAVTKHDDKVIFNDGSTGILAQLRMVTEQRTERKHPTPQAGLIVADGLTRSDYSYTDDKGKTIPASTYYLSE
jgi:hypothetical protein